MHEDIWKVLFKGNETWPEMTEDRGNALAHPGSAVSLSRFKVYPLIAYSRKISKFHYLFFQVWTEKAERIKCPAPLPEEPAIPLLTKMLVPTPYKAPEKKAKGAKSGPRRKGTLEVTSEDDESHSSVPEDNDEEEVEENNRGRLPRIWRRKRPRRGRASQRSTPRVTLTVVRNDAPALSPRLHRK